MLPWGKLRRLRLHRRVNYLLRRLGGVKGRLDQEPLRVLRYGQHGHYAQHSDSGWPGHREVSFLFHLRAPESGGETCLLQLGATR